MGDFDWPIHELCCFVTWMSLSFASNCGTKMAEYANAMPTTMWKDAAMKHATICNHIHDNV